MKLKSFNKNMQIRKLIKYKNEKKERQGVMSKNLLVVE